MNNQLTTQTNEGAALSMFQSAEMFDLTMRQAEYVSKSDMIPKEFRDKPANCAIALEIAGRIGGSWFMVMQSLDVIHARPSWRAQFLIGMINSCGRFGPLQFEMTVTGDERTVALEYDEWDGFGTNKRKVAKKLNYSYTPTTCVAHAVSKLTGETVRGPSVSYDMAIDEGWVSKAGSKWQTPMRELMLTYRAGSFFSRIHCSDLTLGMQTAEEVRDAGPIIEVEAAEVAAPRPAGNPYAAKALAAPSAAAAPQAASAKSAAAPVKSAAAPAKSQAEPQAEAPKEGRGILVFYEKMEVRRGNKDGKEWAKFTLHYTIPNGACRTADTFSSTLVEPLDNAEEGVMIRIELKENANPKFSDTLTFLELVEEVPAVAATEETSNAPW